MSTLRQYERHHTKIDLAEEIDVTKRPKLTLIEGELDRDLPIADVIALPKDYSHDMRKADIARTDPNAFEALYEEYFGLIRLKASNYYLPGSDAQDLIQEGAIGFYKGVRDYDGQRSSLRSFLDLCITRQMITAVKTATRGKHRPLNEAMSLNVSPSPDGVGDFTRDLRLEETLIAESRPYDEMLVGQEECRNLVSMLTSELSNLESTVLAGYMDGDSYEAIAIKLNINEKVIDNAMQRVKQKIRRYLEERDKPTLATPSEESKDLEQEVVFLEWLYENWQEHIYNRSSINVRERLSDLKNELPEAQRLLLREVRGYLALIALDSNWTHPLMAYQEARRAVVKRSIELTTGEELSTDEESAEDYVAYALINAAIKATHKPKSLSYFVGYTALPMRWPIKPVMAMAAPPPKKTRAAARSR